MNKENKLKITEPSIDNDVEDELEQEPNSISTPAPTDYKEFIQIKFRDGSELSLGSSTTPVNYLCELASAIKITLLDNHSEIKQPDYAG